jgi:hypothetical protein
MAVSAERDAVTEALRLEHRLAIIDGLRTSLRSGPLALRTATTFLHGGRAKELTLEEAAEQLTAERARIVEAISQLPLRATSGRKGSFHGMHGRQKAVRRRKPVPDAPEHELHELMGESETRAQARLRGRKMKPVPTDETGRSQVAMAQMTPTGITDIDNAGIKAFPGVSEADTTADYPQTLAQPKVKKQRRKKKAAPIEEMAYSGVPQVRTAWGGAVPGLIQQMTDEAVADVDVPPGLREADPDSFESCASCVWFNKGLCNLYGGGGPDAVHRTGYPVERDDLCDSWSSLTPPEIRKLVEAVEAERAALALAKGGAAILRRRARVEIAEARLADELLEFSLHLHVPWAEAKHKRLHGQFASKGGPVSASALPPASRRLPGAGQRPRLKGQERPSMKMPNVAKAAAAAASGAPNFLVHRDADGSYYLTVSRPHGTGVKRIKGFLSEKAARKHGEGLVKRLQHALLEVSSSAYPDLGRTGRKDANWVSKTGGLPNYIERIAKHLHYEQGKSISRAIQIAVGVVQRWCKGGGASARGGVKAGSGGVKPATRAKACAAVAQWNAKRAKSKAMTAAKKVAEAWTFDDIGMAEALCLLEHDTRAFPPSERYAEKLWEILGPELESLEEDDTDELDDDIERLEEFLWNKLLHPRLPKLRRGGGQFAEKWGGPVYTERPKVLDRRAHNARIAQVDTAARGHGVRLEPEAGSRMAGVLSTLPRSQVGEQGHLFQTWPYDEGSEPGSRAWRAKYGEDVKRMNYSQGFEGIGDFYSDDPWDRYIAHQASKGTYPSLGRELTPTQGTLADAKDGDIVDMTGSLGASLGSDMSRFYIFRGAHGGLRAVNTNDSGPDFDIADSGDETVTIYRPGAVGDGRHNPAAGQFAEGRTITMSELFAGDVSAGRRAELEDYPHEDYSALAAQGRANPVAGAALSGLEMDAAIGSALKPFADKGDLADWDVVKNKGDYILTVTRTNGDKHVFAVHPDGQIELMSAGSPKLAAAPAPPVPDVVPAGENVWAPPPSGNYVATGESGSPYHMDAGQIYKGEDGHFYQKMNNQKMASKKGPIAAVQIRNLDTGHTKVAPAYALSGKYYDLYNDYGSATGPDDAFDSPASGANTGSVVKPVPASHPPPNPDVFEMLKQSIGSGGAAGQGSHIPSQGPITSIAGKHVVITGKLDEPRKAVEAKLESAGAVVHSSVTNKVDYLILGDNVGGKKIGDAEKKGVKAVPYSDVKHLLEAELGVDTCRLIETEVALQEATDSRQIVRLRARRAILLKRLEERDYSTAQRKAMAKSGHALDDGSFPIKDKTDLKNAVGLLKSGHGKNKPKAWAHVAKRAGALGVKANLRGSLAGKL